MILPGAATGNRRSSSSRSQGTAREDAAGEDEHEWFAHEPETSRDGQTRRFELVRCASKDADRRTVAFRNAASTHCASEPIADGRRLL